MVRIGEKIVAFTCEGVTTGMVGISTRDPPIGSKILAVPDGEGGLISVRPFNAYTGDEGVAMPLPCGTSVYLPGEPPNYLPPSWESGVGMSCQQGVPETDGWLCGAGCTINPASGYICKRYQSGGNVDIYNQSFCTHPSYSGVWRANKDNNWVWSRKKYYCPNPCPYWRLTHIVNNVTTYTYCPGRYIDTFYYEGRYGGSYGLMYPSAGCVHPQSRLGPVEITKLDSAYNPARDYWQCYGGSGGACPWYNSGSGTPSCQANPRPPAYSPGPSKPAACKQQGQLSFSGWSVPGGSQSKSSGSCVLNKATEGAKDSSDGNISCVFSR